MGVFTDNSVVDHDGNLFDACSMRLLVLYSHQICQNGRFDDRPKIIEGAEGPARSSNNT